HPDLRENEYDLTIFARIENGLYQRTSETHVEKAYPMETVKRLAE
ncbi:MAG TPA: SAM-dependent methyltransferase, partial [Lachnospiraceae bacterium]|nr:SAM-dependent methyltransferase [Lachnospiraceae bacterium]